MKSKDEYLKKREKECTILSITNGKPNFYK